jgi:ribonuclease J
VVAVIILDAQTGALQALPDIISRGFVYMKEHHELIMQARNKTAQILKEMDPQSALNGTYLKDQVRDLLGEFLFIKTQQRPMIIPVIIEV